MRTALAVPSVGPGLGAERTEGVVELGEILETVVAKLINVEIDGT